MSDVKEIIKDIRKVRDDLVAQSNPHYQDLTNIIYKWETKIATGEIEQLERFKQREQEERKNLEEYSRKAREENASR